MKAKHDPEQVTRPLEVARQAALVGGASGTHIVISPFHPTPNFASLMLQFTLARALGLRFHIFRSSLTRFSNSG
jgi:hypothetical protein